MEGANRDGSFFEDVISSDLALRIIQWLNVADSGRLACTSQRYYYLVHQYRRWRGPEIAITTDLLTLAGIEQPTKTERVLSYSSDEISSAMAKDWKKKLQSKPNLILGFSTPSNLVDAIKKDTCFPVSPRTCEAISLNVVAHQRIQVYQPELGQSGVQSRQPKLDYKSRASLMAMSFPGATIMPYLIRGQPQVEDLEFMEHRLRFHNKSNDENFWKAMILYAVGSGVQASDQITTRIQALMPSAVIVGGACREGFVSMPTYTKEELSSMSIKNIKYVLSHCCSNAIHEGVVDRDAAKNFLEKSELVDCIYAALEKERAVTSDRYSSVYTISGAGILGVFLGGNVPIKSVVSRGVHSVLNNNGPPQPFSDLVVHETALSRPGDDDYLFGGHDQPPIHLIRKIRDKATGVLYSPIELMVKYFPAAESQIDFLGLKRKGWDGFQLSSLNEMTQALNAFAILTDGSEPELETLEEAEMDFFCLNGEACMEDMDRTMLKLKEQTKGEEILGALMYTCNGRGPEIGYLIPEEMSDAKRFARSFPAVPCLGFYAAGEYGPIALAGNENVFQKGRASLQGFTAVFALFIVPVRDLPSTYDWDDSIQNVEQFVRHRLH
ncbi:unnamed protein product [Pseudo-nitzschia multistriata]|uniref:FIST C-domain domain-containing protein n=1 Tax=Pseudo-nitzschia multistriata TaxID=183589 RepID=A0A448YYB5_9STRA|nr:unnamed protein product [Pseudo-nitzschia multistriata]